MAEKVFPNSQVPIRKSVELLPQIFQTEANAKFMAGAVDPLIQPGVLDKIVGYLGRRYGKTYKGNDIYLDSNETLRSRYQLEPAVVLKDNVTDNVSNYYDYLDFKNQLKFFGNQEENDSLTTSQEHYNWNPPIDWDKFVNFREYYWIPNGPPAVFVQGQAQNIISSYRVKIGDNNEWILYPDGATPNPTLTLYRGQTYKFQINTPGNGFTIRTTYDTGSLLYNPDESYQAGQLALYDGKLWRAKVPVGPEDGSSISLDSQDWEYVDSATHTSVLDYTKGVTNNGIEKGTLTFTVPLDAPDTLFYQSNTSNNTLGRFVIQNIESNTKIDIESEILGKEQYRSSNDVEFTNGLAVKFTGTVLPETYASGTYIIEGVGKSIQLVKLEDLSISSSLNANAPEVLFDNEGFDTQPFDDATAYPATKDYITINRSAIDNNPWSRYNRWFHKDVLEYAYNFNNSSFDAAESARAKRPIIEFQSGIQLFNHGARSKTAVDMIDTFTTDVFSNIEGSLGYNVDGEQLFEGARVLFTADTDSLVNNKIFVVTFIRHNSRTQISLKEADDAVSEAGDCLLVRRGNNNQGLMYHFTGSSWVKSQEKTAINQSPLFDVFDSTGTSFSDESKYPVTTFTGTPILGYKVGNSVIDSELGFSLSYQNIDNVGDIEFNFNFDSDLFYYQDQLVTVSKNLNTGFLKQNTDSLYFNCWSLADSDYIMPIIDSKTVEENLTELYFDTVYWNEATSLEIFVYKNGFKYTGSYSREESKFTFTPALTAGDVISLKIFTDAGVDKGYYEIPIGLEKNPLNEILKTFTLGTAADHVASAIEFDSEYLGDFPGVSNLRDIDRYRSKAKRFLKHSGIPAISMALLADKNVNIIKSLQYAKSQYTIFKNNFLKQAEAIGVDQNPIDMVDTILSEMSRVKNSNTPFAVSDMVGTGAYSSIEYVVEDTGIKTFSLSTRFSLSEPSDKAVYVYINNQQLIVNKDYTFDSTFGFIKISKEFVEGDTVLIREYNSTAACFIPPTPTKLGLYKKYTPMMYLDDTFRTPRMIIQGHDGSRISAFGDYRDDLLLELELRIYNNIKQEYDENIFDIDLTVGSYYYPGLYNKTSLDRIALREFLKWIASANLDYKSNSYFDSEDSFTYTYSNMTDPTETQNLPGYWRGVYQWFYDTDRPHTCPWEMLGFSEQPTWWESVYGPAPYTSNNLILWEDIAGGVIRQGARAGIHERYKRASILDHIPVDADGNLKSPLDSNLAHNYALINNQGPFALGDAGPVESAWRQTSEWPFAVTIAMCLMRPFKFISDNLDRNRIVTNILDQNVSVSTSTFLTKDDILLPEAGVVRTVGLVNYLVDYLKYQNLETSKLSDLIKNLKISLSARLSGFVDQNQQRFILDSKNPRATSGSVFVPPENYDIIFNVSSPIDSISYSGVLIEKTTQGWVINGYDDLDPYFNYFEPVASQRDPVMSVGGITEKFLEWTGEKFYGNGVIVRYSGTYYRSVQSHTSGVNFETSYWQKLPTLPLVGGVEAFKRRQFNTLRVKELSYGTLLPSIQAVVDFLLGYEQYLKSIGIVFNGYNPETQTPQDFTTACKEFMFWTKHNWAPGSLLSVSPCAERIEIKYPVGVADNLLDSFNQYNVKKSSGTLLDPNDINVLRDFQSLTLTTTNTTEGIYFVKVYYVLKEHVVIFDDRTVFNDVIYDRTTGYRQERIKVRGYRTTDWDGDYTSPGFIFDNVNIEVWKPFTDYRLGDIVSYKSYNWVSLINQSGSAEFNADGWSKLDSTPTKNLVANFDYKINQFEDYFSLDSDGLSTSQKELARHTTGYQTRQYLAEIAEDEVTQFKLYQGFIREKGTANAVTKVFNKLSQGAGTSIVLNEEWAFRVGRLGGTRQLREVEFKINKDGLEINPQPILIQREQSIGTVTDKYLRIPSTQFTLPETPFNQDINPVSLDYSDTLDAGYVNLTQVDHVVKTKDDILGLEITQVNNNDHVWVTFDGPSWTVLRMVEHPVLRIIDAIKSDIDVTLTFNGVHPFAVGDIIGIKDLINLIGFFKITSKNSTSIVVEVASDADDPVIDSSLSKISYFVKARYDSYQNIDPATLPLLNDGSKLFIDNNGNDRWEVVQKNKQYSGLGIVDYGITSPEHTGYKVLYLEKLKQTIAALPRSGYVMSYVATGSGLGVYQIIAPATEFESMSNYSFGHGLAISPDERFLFVGAPLASGVPTFYKGEFEPGSTYKQGDIVLSQGRLWRALDNFVSDGSTVINTQSQDWEVVTLVEASAASLSYGPSNAGTVTIYEWADSQWNLRTTIMSPRVDTNEKFGQSITVSKSGSTYYLAVSAPGAENDKGRVYLFTGNGTTWQHLEDTRYAGVYDPTKNYPEGSIVWSDNSLWEALADNNGDGSSFLTISNNDWKQLDPVSTSCSLPKNTFIDDDGSTLATGMLDLTEIYALTKSGDGFGHDVKMNSDGSILVISAPFSDGQYFANFRGDWISTQEYKEGDVVRWEGLYHRLEEAGDPTPTPDSTFDSTITSVGQVPSDGNPWFEIGDSLVVPSGKIFIYKRDLYNRYNLIETIAASNLDSYSDITASVQPGDNFGSSIDIDSSGYTIVASSPEADINANNQGSVFVFRTESVITPEYRLKQTLESHNNQPNELFGCSVAISSGNERIVVGAKNSPNVEVTRFDTASGTTFDEGKTSFAAPAGYTGQVFVFEKKDSGYLLTERLQTTLTEFESFGFTVDCSASTIVVGSPTYKTNDVQTGFVRIFERDSTKDGLEVLEQQQAQIDLELIKSIQMYDEVNNVKVADIDFVDHRKLKLLGIVEQELSFKTPYDPAVYNIGSEDVVVDDSQTWYEKNIGKLWWNIGTVKWLNYEQDDLAYRAGNWNRTAEGSSIDVYEWVSTPLLPSEWSALADTTDGLALNISGQPLYPNDDVFSFKDEYNSTTGELIGRKYYYWVKNKNVVPSDIPNRKLSASVVASYIINPAQSGIPFVAFVKSNALVAYNFADAIDTDYVVLNIQYKKDRSAESLVHNEYQLLTEGVADSLPTEKLENKWLDSLIGVDSAGNAIPDPALPAKLKYGIEYRPRQSMFIDKTQALKITIERINSVLNTVPVSDNLTSSYLFDTDAVPSAALNLYDIAVDTYVDLQQVGTTRLKSATLSANIVDGRIDSIEIVDPGFGYRTAPPVDIQGDGIGAEAEITLDNQGRVSSVTMISKGRRYSSAIIRIRPFSVLVNYDETADNYWTIYSYDEDRNNFYRSRSQGYDTTRYWGYKDWWESGYSAQTRIVSEIPEFYLEASLISNVGDLIKVKEYGAGGWAVIERTIDGTGTLLGKYNVVGRENGTIYIKDTVYNQQTSPLGYDEFAPYDKGLYDLQPTVETRNLLLGIKNDVFVGDLRVEWNKLFFAGIRQAFSEQLYIDWAFKTSFLNAIHEVGSLEQKVNYRSDNLDSYKDYLHEVKPYRTTIREYTSRYTNLDVSGSATTDFDLPPAYSDIDGKILPVNENYNRFDEYPWKWWYDNQGYEIVDIRIADSGSGYVTPPSVLIEGNGTGAVAEAYIYNGTVSGVKIISSGNGYTQTPTITLVGGYGIDGTPAKAVAILGNGVARAMNLTMKFDRISKTGIYNSLTHTETFTAQGNNSVFELSYCPTVDKTKITIVKNNLPVLSSEYMISLYVSTTDTYSLLKGKLIFLEAPEAGDIISVVYDKNDELFDSVNRIEKYYAPTAGMKGKELNQLMTGIDFGGVQVQATTFDVTGGWDALPWFTDGWDGVEPNRDFGIVADGSTNFVTLPYTPADGEIVTVYIKRVYSDETVRIDDPYFLNYDGSTVQPNGRTTAPDNALMPTFVGDGSTNVIIIGEYVSTNSGDTLIFRPADSDGSVVISDVNIVDTRISGGTLDVAGGAYSTANGMAAEDISIDGGRFLSPEHVPATEENVPGQVLENLSIKVYTASVNGAAPLQTKIYKANGSTDTYSIGLKVTEAKSIVVYVDKVKQSYQGDVVDYTIDLATNTITFITPPADKQLIEIVSIGVGGAEILDYQEFVADGTTGLYLCKAEYQSTQSVFVTVDGEAKDVGFANSSDFVSTTNRVMVQFGVTPTAGSVIKIVCLGTALDTDSSDQSIIRVNQQTIIHDGSTRSYDLDRFVNLSRGSSLSSVLVNLNNRQLKGVDTTVQVYDGTNNSVIVGVDPDEAIGTITSGNIKVFVNGNLLRFVIDYVFDGNNNLITINSSVLTVGDIIKVETDVRSQYAIEGNNINFPVDLVTLVEGDVIDITWFSEYPTMDLISDQATGGQARYKLQRTPLSTSYVWVYKNGDRLTQDQDYYVDVQRSAVYLAADSTIDDEIKIIQFSGDILRLPSAFEIQKDMLNIYRYKRYSADKSVVLAQPLNYYDQEIHVSDASSLTTPVPERNMPGTVIINSEKIDYMIKDGNVLRQLRRGVTGTAIAEVHASGSYVSNSSFTESIPYNEEQDTYNAISDGSTLLIGPLEYVPAKSTRSTWTTTTIPDGYGACDTVEVFVAGRRLRKDPITVYDESLGASSTSADKTLEAEFSVDGSNAYVRLTEAVPIGTQITVIRRTGKVWYDRGQTTITSGKSLLVNESAIAKFISEKYTELPE